MSRESRRVRVLFLTPYMKRGGSQSFIASLLERMDRSVFAPELGTVLEGASEYPIPDDVPVHQVGGDGIHDVAVAVEWPAEVRRDNASEAAWLEWKLGQVAGLVRRVNPDIVFCSPEWASVMAAAASSAFPPGTRLVCRVDAPPSMAFPEAGTDRLLGILARQYLNRADRIASVSPAVTRDLVDNFGVDEERIVLVRNAVDIDRAQRLSHEPVAEIEIEDGTPNVVFVGRIERVKGLRYLLAAMAELADDAPVRCVLVGAGSQEGYVRALAKHLHVEDRTLLVGQQDNPFKYMRRGTVFVLPSLSEGLPTVLVEAMACGCPVVATDIAGGAVRELLEEGESGLIVPREDAGALAAAIRRVLTDEELRASLVQRGLERARDYDLPGIIAENQALLLAVAPPDDAAAAVPGAVSESLPAHGRRLHRPAYLTLANARHVLRRQGPRAFAARVTNRLAIDAPLGGPFANAMKAEVKAAADALSRRPSGRRHLAILVPSIEESGIGSLAETLLKHVDRAAWEVSLVRFDAHADTAPIPGDVARFALHPRPVRGERGARRLTAELEAAHRRALRRMRGVAGALGELCTALQPDAVLAIGYRASILGTMARDDLPGATALVADLHGYTREFVDSWDGADIYGSLVSAYVDVADLVFVPDAESRALLADHTALNASAVKIVPDPVEVPVDAGVALRMTPSERERLEEARVVACYAPAGSAAGVGRVLAAIALAREQEDVRLRVFGEVTADDRARASRLGLDDAVAFSAARGGLDAGLMGASVYVHVPAEGERRVPPQLVEAIASGCAVVSPRSSDAVAGVLGEGARGILVPQGDAEALAEAILQLVWDDAVRRDLVVRAREHLEGVAAEPITKRVEELLTRAVTLRAQGA